MDDYKLLTSEQWSGNLIGEDENHPVNKVYRYLTNNFKCNQSLEEISAMAGFNPAALCRYFKRHPEEYFRMPVGYPHRVRLQANGEYPPERIAGSL